MKHFLKACSVLLLLSVFACNNQQQEQDSSGAENEKVINQEKGSASRD